MTPKVNLALYLYDSFRVHSWNRLIGLPNVKAPQGASLHTISWIQAVTVHRKEVDFFWRQVEVDQKKRGKVSNPIWTRGCGGSEEVTVMTLQTVYFLTISPLSFPITMQVPFGLLLVEVY